MSKHRRRALLDCSSARRIVVPPRRLPHKRRIGGGKSSKSALAIDAICDPAQDVLNFASADFGIELIERAANPNAYLLFSTALDPALGEALRVTVVAIGLAQRDEGLAPRGALLSLRRRA